LTIFAGSTEVAAFSVGQQIATAVLAGMLGFGALVFIFRFRSFREVIARGRAHRRGEEVPAGDPGGPASAGESLAAGPPQT
jgi:hypothetical protein